MKGHRDEIKELYFPIDLEVETNVHVVFETVEPPPPKQRLGGSCLKRLHIGF